MLVSIDLKQVAYETAKNWQQNQNTYFYHPADVLSSWA